MQNLTFNLDYKHEAEKTQDLPNGCKIKLNNSQDSVSQVKMKELSINNMEALQQAGKGREDVAAAEFEFLVQNKFICSVNNEQLSSVDISAKIAYALHRMYIDNFLSLEPILLPKK